MKPIDYFRLLCLTSLAALAACQAPIATAPTLPATATAPATAVPTAAATPLPPTGAPTPKQTTFSSKIYKLHMSVSFSPDWHVLDDYPDLVTVQKSPEGWQLGFNIVNDAKLADPVDGHLVPFPVDFVSWLKSDRNLVAGAATEVMVGGIKGIQIGISANTKPMDFLYLRSGTIWGIATAAIGSFILLNDVHGERVLIYIVQKLDAEQTRRYAEQTQVIIDSVAFTQ
jgi:hypothetical protein